MMKKSILLIGVIFCFYSCDKFFEFEKEVDFSQGNTDSKIVVQAIIQPGLPAYAVLTKSEPFFDPVTEESIQNLFITDASISITDENDNEVALTNILSLDVLSGIIGAELYDSLKNALPGLYIQTEFLETFSQENHRYDLKIIHESDTLTATTTIPNIHPVDSLWFEVDENADRPNLGNFWFHYSDPDTLGNTIMIEHKRVFHTKETLWGSNPSNPNITPNSITVNDIEDPLFIKSLWGFVRNDFEGLNGTSFDTYFQRGAANNLLFNTTEADFEQEENGYFKSGKSVPSHSYVVYPDTVLLRLSQIDYQAYLFWRSADFQASSGGNPFAEPINLQSNINNGLGIFFGQAATYYKVVAKEDTIYKQLYYPTLFEIF
jgi:hypothetical protein